MFEGLVGDERDLAWAAGLFDGEGSTTQEHGYIQIRVAQAGEADRPPEVLIRFHEAFGGVGSIGGPYLPSEPGYLPKWNYTATGPKAGQVLGAMWPALGAVKREQAAAALCRARPSQVDRQDRQVLGALAVRILSDVPPQIDRRRRGGPSGARSGDQLDPDELAWAAGFFDGEGSTFSQQARRYPKISVSQKGTRERPPEVLLRIREAVLNIGDVVGPIKNGDSIKWHYVVHGHDLVQAVIALIWPWLGEVKRSQACSALLAYRAQGIPLRRPGQRRGGPMKSTCKRGHDHSDVVVDRSGKRQCRPCRNLLARERMRQLRLEWAVVRAGLAEYWPHRTAPRSRLVGMCRRGHDPSDVVQTSSGIPQCRPCKNMRQRRGARRRRSSA